MSSLVLKYISYTHPPSYAPPPGRFPSFPIPYLCSRKRLKRRIMEKQVFIKEQRPLEARTYTAADGTTKVFHSRGFVLSTGIDEFYAEMWGDMAREAGEYDKGVYHTVQGYVRARSYQDKNGQARFENQVVITKLI